MGRFDRQGAEGGDLPALLGTATEDFRRSLERQVQSIIEAAQAHAAEIERGADREARERQEQEELRAQEAVQGVIGRASRVLDSIELVQSAISGMLAELRTELKSLESGQPTALPGPQHGQQSILGPAAAIDQQVQAAREVPPTIDQPVRAPQEVQPAIDQPTEIQPQPEAVPVGEAEPEPQPEAEPQPQPQPEAEPQPPPEPQPAAQAEARPERAIDSSAEFDQMIHGEIRRMFQNGKTREDVEEFLGRFELSENYRGLLDELYTGTGRNPPRRWFFGRRRSR